ncbi:LysR family transcriptional regulator [Herbiconiux moechotypicola]|nr:LysR family transcriptional regulator [Herbiconiux moechotypicola]MCS5730782.1 LysR family transcriptional regulator [Herbiconiux moechotypicola]
MELDVRRLMTLRAVRDCGGVLAASAALHISPSAVSQQLAKLERETGLRLVDRSTSGRARLTVAGTRLCERADAIAAELRDAREDLRELAGERQRTVTVGAFPSVVDALAVPAARLLRESEHPVHLRVTESRGDLAATHAALLAGTLDLALVKHGDDTLPDGIAETLVCDDPYRIVIPADWPRPATAAELMDVPWVGHPEGSPGREPLARLEAAEGATLRVEHECTEYTVALALVRAGLAAAVLPALALPHGREEGVAMLEIGHLGHRRIAARTAAGRISAAVATATDALRRVAGEARATASG